MGVIPERISRISQVRGILWDYWGLCLVGTIFSVYFLLNQFWIAVLPPYGYITWPVVAQILYWWISPLWRARYPIKTKSMLRGEVADLKYKLSRKKLVVKQYSKTVMNLLEEIKRLKKEIVEVTVVTPT